MAEGKKSWFKKAWDWLDGKKTIIGGTLLVFSTGTELFVPEYTIAGKLGILAGTISMLIGIGHKYQKRELNNFLPSGLRKK